ncbi:MAG: O-antigen ligase family protein [Caldilineaceae bacterium]|nr:O-antigen ligase family protein [Caldilineaceae bacterium]
MNFAWSLASVINSRCWFTTFAVTIVVLALTSLLGQQPSVHLLMLLIGVAASLFLIRQPVLGTIGIVIAGLTLRLDIETGTAVILNPVTLLIPAVLTFWLLNMVLNQDRRMTPSPANLPLFLFLVASLFSLFVGRATWDPAVPVHNSFYLVQTAQWAIFAFSAGAFWLTANLVQDKVFLWRMTATFLTVGGTLAILRLLPGLDGQMGRFTTIAFIRAPLWALLTAVAGGQLLWNHRLSILWKLFLATVLLTGLYYAFFVNRESSSTWIGVGAALGVLIWLRFPGLRLPLIAAIVILSLTGVLFPTVYDFAGGDDDWFRTGGSRWALISRVVEVTMRNPVTGLGPAAYRLYANMEPLVYAHIFWVDPRVNSHNNYVDLFSHGGLLGVTLFFWFAIEVMRLGLGLRLRKQYQHGFAGGYINGILAAGAASLILMLFADWILPFVYNIGFPGFQASVLVWLFLGGLVSLDRIDKEAEFRNADCLTPELPAERQ